MSRGPKLTAAIVVIMTIVVATSTVAYLRHAQQNRETLALFYQSDPRDFEPVPKPGVNDWLAWHHESVQTFEQFLREPHNVPNAQRHVIYIQPLDAIGDDRALLEKLRLFAEAFFDTEVRLLPPLRLDLTKVRHRDNAFTKTFQLHTADILKMLRPALPADAFCLLGVTMTDLYPDDSWNFVFGVAELKDRIGVYSFARFDPMNDPFHPELRFQRDTVILRRACRVLAHETGHMFGIRHCTFYRCLMNGANHLDESDSQPLHLCPVDFQKLQSSVRFDPLPHTRRLADVTRELGFADEAKWYSKRVRHVTDPTMSP